MKIALAFIIAAMSLSEVLCQAPPPVLADESVAVKETYDNSPFDYTIKLLEKKETYDIYKLTYPSPMKSVIASNNTIHAWYYLPNTIKPGSAPRPAVVCLHILGGGQELTHMICAFMAEQGLPAMMFMFPYYGERKPPGWKEELLKRSDRGTIYADSLKQMVADTRRTLDVISSRPEVNRAKVSIEGISMGGFVAATVAALDRRIDKAAILISGGNLEKMIGYSQETKWLRQFIDGLPEADRKKVGEAIREVDPLTHAAKLRGKAEENKIIMMNASCDEVIPAKCSKELAEAMGMAEKQEWLEGLGHYTAIAGLPKMLERMAVFFSDETVSKPENDLSGEKEPLKYKFIRNLVTLLQLSPEKDQCFLIDADISVRMKDGKDVKGRVRLVRGEGDRFMVKIDMPQFTGSAGYGDYPWLVSKNGVLFRGCLEMEADSRPWKYVSPMVLPYQQMAVGICVLGMNSSSSMLDQIVMISEKPGENGKTDLLLSSKDSKATFLIKFKNGDGLPERIDFDISGNASGTVVFRQWETEGMSTPELFQEPPAVRSENVSQKDLDRVFAALINQLVEKVK